MSARVHPKAKAAGGAGTGSVVLVWLAGQVGIDMPPEVASAFTALVAGAAAWAAPWFAARKPDSA